MNIVMFRTGDEVYCKDTGHSDVGVVVGYEWDRCPHCGSDYITGYRVRWDDPSDGYGEDTYKADQLCMRSESDEPDQGDG